MPLDTRFSIPTFNGILNVPIKSGNVILLVGPNGVGKSALIHQMSRSFGIDRAELFPGHRQIHFQNDDIETVGQPLTSIATNRYNNHDNTNRFKDAWSEAHLKSVLKRLLDFDNQINRTAICQIREYRFQESEGSNSGVRPEVVNALKVLDDNPSLIDILNSIFKSARLEVEIALDGGVLKAKRDGATYPLDRLSDGERAALLIVAAILVRPKDGIVLIDEPEKHLNPAIFGSLIAAAVRSRRDVGFILASHDLSLIDWLEPNVVITVKHSTIISDRPESRTYEAYQVQPNDGVSEEVKRSILGVRKSVLFVEGQSGSDDPLLYGSLFKKRSVVAKGGWETVVGSVRVLKRNTAYHWLNVDGLIDQDGRSLSEVQAFSQEGVYCLGVPTIENLYFLKPVLAAMSEAIYSLKGGKTTAERVEAARLCLPDLFQTCRNDIISRQTVWVVNRLLSERKVSVNSLLAGQQNIAAIDVSAQLQIQTTAYDQATQSGNIETLEGIPIKNTRIPAKLAEAVGYDNFKDYKTAVLNQIDLETELGKKIVAAMKNKVPNSFEPTS